MDVLQVSARIPPAVTVYGLLGVIPVLAPPLVPFVAPSWAELAARVLSYYGALILSFLAGARWGMAVMQPVPIAGIVSLAMMPSLVGLGLLLVPGVKLRLVGLAVGLSFQWFWDVRSAGLPAWYPRLRSILTAGAVVGLAAGAVTLP